ncbi:MAG: hypothetical protein OEL89_01285 [Candidatus Peregrinibacteria bacterium]|nr:hypothetical protein [Candidatus Peregrinibacteria bacterium]
MKKYDEALYDWLVEELWGSGAYSSPEEHARCILNYIFDKERECECH